MRKALYDVFAYFTTVHLHRGGIPSERYAIPNRAQLLPPADSTILCAKGGIGSATAKRKQE